MFTTTANACLFVQLRNVASTRSRNATPWPLVSPQRWWWLPWVLYMWFWHGVEWFCSYSIRWCWCWQCISSQWCLLLEVGCTTKLSLRETSCWMCVNVLGWVWFTPLTTTLTRVRECTHTYTIAWKHCSSCVDKCVSITLFSSLHLKTVSGTEAVHTQRRSTGWTGLRKNMMCVWASIV